MSEGNLKLPRRQPTEPPEHSCARGVALSRIGLVALGLLAPAACTVGPDFRSPEPLMPASWAGVPRQDAPQPPGATVAVQGPTEVARWWAIFNDAELASLVERAASGNLEVQQAQARL